jgi:SpoVK/Ycf46/Vps4 family AAA+-type ATPase
MVAGIGSWIKQNNTAHYMKITTLLAALLMTACIPLNLWAQPKVLLQKLPLLTAAEITAIESSMPPVIRRESETRAPGQFNVLIFSGENETNKLALARYLAQQVNAAVYRVDLSMVVAGNFQETKNNLSLVFETVKDENFLLFFDEGEALFGVRRTVANAHDKYANPETHYFFNLIEKHRGSIILSVISDNNINPVLFEKYVRICTDRR